jgi:hypothetical protein
LLWTSLSLSSLVLAAPVWSVPKEAAEQRLKGPKVDLPGNRSDFAGFE